MPKSPPQPTGSTTLWKTPEPTDVLSYAYLWAREASQGRDEASKDRPVVVVLATVKRDGLLEVLVAPVTTSIPSKSDDWVEMPASVKMHLGLDDRRSWIVVDEVNRFNWPGPDVRPAIGKSARSPYYGQVPGNLLRIVRETLAKKLAAGKLQSVKRSD